MGMTYYYYPVSNCGNYCQLHGRVLHLQRWWKHLDRRPRPLAVTMQLSWLPNTFSGRMVADYVATVFPAGGRSFPIYVIAQQPTGGLFHQAVYTAGYGYTRTKCWSRD